MSRPAAPASLRPRAVCAQGRRSASDEQLQRGEQEYLGCPGVPGRPGTGHRERYLALNCCPTRPDWDCK
eukprot:6628676-Alexandrium_andersonii.AAC.1